MPITDIIGNTPLVQIKNIHKSDPVKIFSKLEGQNPGGSVKDRPAFNMIQSALDRKDLKAGDTIVEATSGNTGIALAMAGNVLGVRVVLIMPDTATEERKKTMAAYGAALIETPGAKTIEYAREFADKLARDKGYYQLNQFANPDNYLAHYKSTGPEIWRDTEGEITHFVSSMGTTGTIMGVSRYLKEQNRAIQIIGCQPTDGSRIPGIRRWSPEFLPKIYEPHRVDRIIDVSSIDAIKMSRRLANEEGIFAGMSSGGAMHVACQLAKEVQRGLIVAITCDRGDRYLSSDLYD